MSNFSLEYIILFHHSFPSNSIQELLSCGSQESFNACDIIDVDIALEKGYMYILYNINYDRLLMAPPTSAVVVSSMMDVSLVHHKKETVVGQWSGMKLTYSQIAHFLASVIANDIVMHVQMAQYHKTVTEDS